MECVVGVGKVQRYIVDERSNFVDGVRRVSGQRRQGSKWWSEKAGVSLKREELGSNGCNEQIGIHMTVQH